LAGPRELGHLLRRLTGIGRRFDPRLDASRPSREMAIAWAEEERKAMEKGS
jgi:hypothetical protein